MALVHELFDTPSYMFFKTIFIKPQIVTLRRQYCMKPLYFHDVTFWPESDYSLSVVFTCIANISFNFSASE